MKTSTFISDSINFFISVADEKEFISQSPHVVKYALFSTRQILIYATEE